MRNPVQRLLRELDLVAPATCIRALEGNHPGNGRYKDYTLMC